MGALQMVRATLFIAVIALAGVSSQAAIVVLSSDQTDYTFQTGNTYYITNIVTISGTATLEGGTVIKYGSEGGLSVYDVDCETTAGNPAYFTSRDDDTVGEVLADSTHVPTVQGGSWPYGNGGSYLDTALLLNNCGNDLQHIKISYCNYGLYYLGADCSVPDTLEDADIRNCNTGIFWEGDYLDVYDSRFRHTMIDGEILDITWSNVLFNAVWVQDQGLGGLDDPPEGSYFADSLLANTHFDPSSTFAIGSSNQFFNSGVFGDNYQILDLHAPSAFSQTVIAGTGTWTGITLTASDPDNDPLTYIVLGSPLHGYLWGTPPDLAYVANPGYVGTDSFTFTVDDGILDSTNATVSIIVDDPIQFDLWPVNYYVNTNLAGVWVALNQGHPVYQAILIGNTNFASATWTSYGSSNLTVNLGSMSNGVYEVWVGLKGFSSALAPVWQKVELEIDTNSPVIRITAPVLSAGAITSGIPLLQIQGEATKNITALSFDVSNAVSYVTNQPGLVLDRFFDTNKWDFTTNYFQCFDIYLTNGPNLITIHASDWAGNTITTNLLVTLDYSLRTNPPLVDLVFPQDGMKVAGSTFTANGFVDDATAQIGVQITDASGNTNDFTGVVERTGRFWVDNMPLASGTNYLTYTITDAASNVLVTNVTIVQSTVTLAMNALSDQDMWLTNATVTGTVSDASATVWVNGVQGTNNGDGTWSVTNVPMTPGGVAVFNMTAYPSGENPSGIGSNGQNPLNPNATSTQNAPVKPTIGAFLASDLQVCDINDSWYDQIGSWSETETTIGHYTQEWAWNQDAKGFSSTYDIYSNSQGTNIDRSGNNAAAWDNIEYPYDEPEPESGSGASRYSIIGFEHCAEQITYPDEDDYGDNQHYHHSRSYSRLAQTQTRLVVGGRGLVDEQVLVDLTGSAQDLFGEMYNERLLSGPYESTYAPTWAQPSLPYQQIAIGGFGKLYPDGHLWVVMVPGVYDITASVPGHKFYTMGSGAVQRLLSINANGYDLGVTQPEFCVGQQIAFVPDWIGGEPPYVNAFFHWHLPDKFVNEPYQYSATCNSYRLNMDWLTNRTIHVWYVNGRGGNCSIGMNLQMPNGQDVSIAATGSYQIFRPHVSIDQVMTTPYYTISDQAISVCKLKLGENDQSGNGDMFYKVRIDSTPIHTSPQFEGDASITQLITANYSDPAAYFSDERCDGPEFYNGDYFARIICTGKCGLDDGPFEIWASPNIINLSARDFVRFKPDGDNNIFVTLGIVEWDTVGVATRNTFGIWSKTTDQTAGPLGPDPSDEFPTWQKVYKLNSQ